MVLQTSGAISLANIQTEFGGSNPIGLNEYYGVAAGIPTSGQISVNQFYGASAIKTASSTYPSVHVDVLKTTYDYFYYQSADGAVAQYVPTIQTINASHPFVTGGLMSGTKGALVPHPHLGQTMMLGLYTDGSIIFVGDVPGGNICDLQWLKAPNSVRIIVPGITQPNNGAVLTGNDVTFYAPLYTYDSYAAGSSTGLPTNKLKILSKAYSNNAAYDAASADLANQPTNIGGNGWWMSTFQSLLSTDPTVYPSITFELTWV